MATCLREPISRIISSYWFEGKCIDSDCKLCDRATGFATPGPHSIGVIVTQAVHPKPRGGFSLTNRSQSVEQATQT